MVDTVTIESPFGDLKECLHIVNESDNDLAYNFGDILKHDGDYTFSCWIKADKSTKIKVQISNHISSYFPINIGWNKIIFTATANIKRSRIVLFSVPANNTIYAFQGMLEAGNIPSDFKKNEEDLEQTVTTLQTDFKIEQGKITSLIKETDVIKNTYTKKTDFDNLQTNFTTLSDKYNQTVQTVEGNKTTIGNIKTIVDGNTNNIRNIDSRVTAVETTAEGIKSSVSKFQETADSAQSLAEQTASKFSWLVKSGTNETDFTLTDRTASLVADEINLHGLVKFKGLDTDTQTLINNTKTSADKSNTIIENWAKDAVVNGETTINGGYLQNNTITTNQLAVTDIFATGSAVMNIINAQEINADRITSGKIAAEYMSLYGLSVYNKESKQQTLNIDNDGEVTIRGSVSSYNYNEGKTGWSINNDGTAEFNDIIARGSVITSDGGIVSSGGSGTNLLVNSSTFDGWERTHGQFQAQNDNGISVISASQFANATSMTTISIWSNKLDFNVIRNKDFVFTVEMMIDNYSTWTDQCPIVLEYYNGTDFRIGWQAVGINDKSVKVVGDKEDGEWVKLVFTRKGNADSITFSSGYGITDVDMFCIRLTLKGNGTIRFRKPKLELGTVATDYSLAPEDKIKKVRFWAGSSYEQKELAPFIVYNDGSIKATRGEYSGLWTGDIKIGNISIVDPSANAGNDAILTILNGQTGIKRVQLTDTNASSFAQDILITDSTESTMISLKQDGTGIFNKGISINNSMTLNENGILINENELSTDSNGFVVKNHLSVGTERQGAGLTVHGDASMNNAVVNNSLTFGRVIKFSKVTNGLNIDYIGG